MLSPGDEFVDRSGRANLSHVDIEDALDWQRGLLTFREDTLATAAAELNRYSPTSLVVRDRRIAGLRVSGSFRAGDPARFARAIALIHPVRAVTGEDGTVELVGVR
jgi:transmembrane sensor